MNSLCSNMDDAWLVTLENQDYVEDKLIALCKDMEDSGVHIVEIASGLLFTTHYLLSKKESEDAERYYKYLLKQCHAQIEALHEFYALPIEQEN